jgi:membrane fusion protein, copper/silver efflux system
MRATLKVIYALGVLGGFAAAYGLGRWQGRQATLGAPAGRPILYYRDPMHPAYRSDKPGRAPDCGMPLEPVYLGDDVRRPEVPGEIHISEETQHLIGVRTEAARRQAASHMLRLPGRVTVDETRVYRITARVEGWAREIAPTTTGARVRKGQRLLAISGRECRALQQAFIYAVGTLERTDKNAEGEALEQARAALAEARANLANLGVENAQLDELARARQPQPELRLVSPVDGFILQRNVVVNQRLEPGAELYRLADLTRVWIAADLSQNEAPYVRAGARARVSLAGSPKVVAAARVSDVPPQFDGATRTLKLRLEVDNPQAALRPDMLVDVEVPAELPATITIPADAVVDGGMRKTVFVDLGNGYFAPRAVQIGWRFDDLVEIVAGIEPGEKVVTGGTFLVDSESRLRGADGQGEPPDAERYARSQPGSQLR